MAKVYVFVHPAYQDLICYPQTVNLWESFARCGATVCYGDSIDAVVPEEGDQLVSYGRMDEHKEVLSRFPCRARWSYVVDESSKHTEAYDKSLSYCRLLGYDNMVVTYQNAAHLAKLKQNGIRYVVMPHTMPAIRPLLAKEYGIILSGQVHPDVYPTRTRVWNAIQQHQPQLAFTLFTPGQDISTRQHNVIHDRYYELLDRCWMGAVCSAGDKDRFVSKYVEFGACHVLPVGDCPSYMPKDMQRLMVNVEGMHERDIAEEVRRLLQDAPEELHERTERYSAQVKARYLADPNMRRLLAELVRSDP